MACNASGDKPLLESTCFWSRRLFALLILLQLFRIIELAWACSSAGRAPALQVSRLNHISAASGVAYGEPHGATTLSNWTDLGPKALGSLGCPYRKCYPARTPLKSARSKKTEMQAGPIKAIQNITLLHCIENLPPYQFARDRLQNRSPAGPSRGELSTWIRGLPEKDKDELLITAAVDLGERRRNDLVRRFRRRNLQQTSDVLAASERRKAGDLLAAAHVRAKERARLLNEQRTAEAAKRRAEDLANRERYLDQLGRRQLEIWKQVAAHVQTRQPKDYDRAVSLLTDLHDLSVRRSQTAGFLTSPEKIRQVHAAKESFLSRLAKANL